MLETSLVSLGGGAKATCPNDQWIDIECFGRKKHGRRVSENRAIGAAVASFPVFQTGAGFLPLVLFRRSIFLWLGHLFSWQSLAKDWVTHEQYL